MLFMESSKTSTTYLASSIERQRGGCILKTLPYIPVLPNRHPLSLVASMSLLASYLLGSWPFRSLTISMAIMRPLPLTSPIVSYRSCNFLNSEMRKLPTLSAFSANFYSLMTLRTSIPTLHCTCPPPKVLK